MDSSADGSGSTEGPGPGSIPASTKKGTAKTAPGRRAAKPATAKSTAAKSTAAKPTVAKRAGARQSTPARSTGTTRWRATTRSRAPDTPGAAAGPDAGDPVSLPERHEPDGSHAGASPWPDRPSGGRGRARSRDLYNRRVQRTHEQWPVVTRALAGVLRHPGTVLGILGARETVEREGRVLNPGIQAMIGVIDQFGGTKGGSPGADLLHPALLRRQLRRSARLVMPVRTDVYVSGRVIPGPEGGQPLAVRLYRRFGSGPGDGPGRDGRPPAVVYFHGGGWVTGDLDTHDPLCRILAATSGCLVVAVDYRLAPEHPFPAAVDDALAAYTWVHEHSDELGIAPGQIGVMGDSAGGNLAAVVAQLTRPGTGRVSAPPPVAQGLAYPVVDARLGFESMRSLAEGFLLTQPTMAFYRDQYLPDRADWESPKASPLMAGDLRGLAPALVVTAGFDPLRDDGVNYAEALRTAGVAVEHRRYDDQVHGFMMMGIVPDSLALATEVCEAMGQLMRRSAPVATS